MAGINKWSFYNICIPNLPHGNLYRLHFFRSYDNSERFRGQLQEFLVFMEHEVLIGFQKVEDAMFSMGECWEWEMKHEFSFFFFVFFSFMIAGLLLFSRNEK